MKIIKIFAITMMIAAALMLTTACVMSASAETAHYTKEGIVTAWEQIGNSPLRMVTVLDEDGTIWDLFDDDLVIGDTVVLLLRDLGSEHEEADEVMDVMRIEHLEYMEMYGWMKNRDLI